MKRANKQDIAAVKGDVAAVAHDLDELARATEQNAFSDHVSWHSQTMWRRAHNRLWWAAIGILLVQVVKSPS